VTHAPDSASPGAIPATGPAVFGEAARHVAGQVLAAIVVVLRGAQVTVPAEALHGADVATGQVQRPGDTGMSQPVRP
jgi:hypothetical protein